MNGKREGDGEKWRKEKREWANKNVGVLRKLNFYGMRAKHDPLFYFILRRSVV